MPRLLTPFITADQNPSDLARQWLASALPGEWSDQQRRAFERGLGIADIDLRGVAVAYFESLERVAPHLEKLLKEEGSPAVHGVLSTVSFPQVEVLAHIAGEWAALSKRIRSLKNFARLAKILRFSGRMQRQIAKETNRRIAELQATLELGRMLDLDLLRRKKQSPHRAVPVLHLAELLIANGYPKRAAFRFTADFLRDWAPDRYRSLNIDHVRHRYEHHQKKKRGLASVAPKPQEISAPE